MATDNRFYDPNIGKFISPDPLMDLRMPEWANPYSYAGNNPISRMDPSGLASCSSSAQCEDLEAKAKEQAKAKAKKKAKPDPRLVAQKDAELRKRIAKIAEQEWKRVQKLAKKYGGINKIPETEFNKYFSDLRKMLGKKTYEKMFGKWFKNADANTAWCAVFTTWVLMKAGVKAEDLPSKNAAWATEWGKNKGKHSDPRVGDIVVYGKPGKGGGLGESGHVEFVTDVHEDGTITTIGGNRSNRVNKQRINPKTAIAGEGSGKLIYGYISPPVRVPGYPGVQGNWPWL